MAEVVMRNINIWFEREGRLVCETIEVPEVLAREDVARVERMIALEVGAAPETFGLRVFTPPVDGRPGQPHGVVSLYRLRGTDFLVEPLPGVGGTSRPCIFLRFACACSHVFHARCCFSCVDLAHVVERREPLPRPPLAEAEGGRLFAPIARAVAEREGAAWLFLWCVSCR